MLQPILRVAMLGLAMLAASCGTVVNVATNVANQAGLQGATGIADADAADLRAGRIAQVRDRYEQRPLAQLSFAQRSLLCDIDLKYRDFDRAAACLDGLSAAGSAADRTRIDGKRALIALALGDSTSALQLSAQGDDTGSVYVHALAAARTGDKTAARNAASRFAHGPGLKLIYYAAALYSAAGDYDRSLQVLKDPLWRLLRNYGVAPVQTIFGAGQPAPFRLDVFDEFSYGWLNPVSYAPAGNAYVELLAAHDALELGDTAEAVQRLDTLLAYPALDDYRDVEWQVLFDRARAADRQGQRPQAIAQLQRCIALIESMRKSIGSDEGRIGFASRFQSAYATLVQWLVESGQTEMALGYAERARSRALVDLLASRDNLTPAELTPAHAAQLLEGLDRAEGEQLLPIPTGGDPATRSVEAPRRLGALVSQAPSLAPLISVQPVAISEMQARLAPNETALAYFQGASHWYCFVVTARDVHAVTLPEMDLNSAVLGFRQQIGNKDLSVEQAKSAAQSLYAALVRPAEPYIQSNRVVIAPYGVLHYLPFAALHDGRQFWVERTTIRSVPSLTALTQVVPQHGPSSGSLVFGNPTRTDGQDPLVNAEQEARDVARLLPQPAVYLGPDATLAHFQAQVGDKRFVHLAMHGEFVATAPLQSRLLFASNGPKPDLTVADLYTMRMNAALVTLSACDSGLGWLLQGDEFVGLVRGFLFAGSRNVVATLWHIPDTETEALMVTFYQGVANGQPVAMALQQAQIKMLQLHPHPYYWAAFIPSSFAEPL